MGKWNGRKWSRQDWYQYHKNKAIEQAVETYTSKEQGALNANELKIDALLQEVARLEASQSLLGKFLSSVFSSQVPAEVTKVRADLERARAEHFRLYEAARVAKTKAIGMAAGSYHSAYQERKEDAAEAAAERRIRYLERSPAIRSAQSAIKAHILAEYASAATIDCYYCKTEILPDDMHIDHKTPVARGGTNSRRNLVLSCARCNLQKGKKTEAEYRRYLESKP